MVSDDAGVLCSIGFYRSPLGGAPGPSQVPSGHLLFELISAGAVYDPGDRELCGPGWVFAHGPGQQTIHRCERTGSYSCGTFLFALSGPAATVRWDRAFCWQPAEGALAFCQDMLSAFHAHLVERELLGRMVWDQMRFRMARHRQGEPGDEVPRRLARVIRHIDLHPTVDDGMEILAGLAGLSPSHLHAIFKAQVGMSPHRYRIQQRMRLARELLVASQKPIAAIARAVGYANPETFCRTFRQWHHCTPGAYRQSHARLP